MPGITVLVITTRCDSRLRAITPPMASQTGNTYRNEKPPDGSEGVATTMNVVSVEATACATSEVAVSRLPAMRIVSASSGSNTGGRPARIASTFAASASTPTTVNPLAANAAAIGAPSLPSPTTEMFFVSVIVFPAAQWTRGAREHIASGFHKEDPNFRPLNAKGVQFYSAR
jgi:hypothetical protein